MKSDDHVKCINAQGTDFKLKEGRIYTIENIDHYTGLLFLKEIQGSWAIIRFVHVADANFALDESAD